MKNYILDIIHLNNEFTGDGMFLALYFVTLLFIAFYIKNKKYKEVVLYPSLVLLGLVYVIVPFINNFVFSIYDGEIRGRFAWVFMAPAIIALGLTLFVDNAENKKVQGAIVCSIVPVIFLCGVFQINDYRFKPAENLYKMPQSLIDVCDYILDEQREDADGIARIIVPYETAHVYRQYSTDIELLYGEDATYGRIWAVYDERRDVCDTMQTTCPDLKLITEVGRDYDMEYLLLDTVYVDFSLDSLNNDGYTEDENFVGDRTPDSEVVKRMENTVSIDEKNMCYDLSQYNLGYVGKYGQYLLYKFY